MARLFDNVQEEYLERDQAILAGAPFAFVCKFNTDDIVSKLNKILFWMGNKDNDNEGFYVYLNYLNDTIRVVTKHAGVGKTATVSASYLQDTWHHACGIWASLSDVRALFDGANKGTSPVITGAPTGLDRISIGRRGQSTAGLYMSGMIAEAAIYDLSAYPGATASNKADYFEANILPHLVAGEPPGDYTTGLESYWPLRDDDLDYADDFDLTAFNTPSWAEHPTVLHLLDGTIPVQSTIAGNLQWLQELAGLIEAQSSLTGNIIITESLAGSIAGASNLPSINLQWLQELAGIVDAQSSLAGNIDLILVYTLTGSLIGQSGVAGSLKAIESLAGLIEAQSGLTGNLRWPQVLAGLIEAQSGAAGSLQWLQELAGAIGAQSSSIGNIKSTESLAGLIGVQSSVDGNLQWLQILAGAIAAQSTVTAKLRDLSSLSGSLASQSSVAGSLRAIESLIGGISVQSSLLGNLQLGCGAIPPALQAAIIDPYSGGAWLWLVEIFIPGYRLIRLAKNTEDITYGGVVYNADNLNVGLAGLSGDGSIPRTILQVAQDKDYTLENKINATKGASGGWVKIIRAHENYLDKFIAELEDIVDILTADSDTTHVVFQLGIPNPLLKKIPLRRYSSKICPYHIPGLFGGVECQYPGDDPTCTGKFEDCNGDMAGSTKDNAVHFGADLGLDPAAMKV